MTEVERMAKRRKNGRVCDLHNIKKIKVFDDDEFRNMYHCPACGEFLCEKCQVEMEVFDDRQECPECHDVIPFQRVPVEE